MAKRNLTIGLAAVLGATILLSCGDERGPQESGAKDFTPSANTPAPTPGTSARPGVTEALRELAADTLGMASNRVDAATQVAAFVGAAGCSCVANGDCASNSCKGKPGDKHCR